MDSNTLYAAAMVGRQEDYNDAIIKEAWAEDGYESMTELKAQDACEAAYEKHGADVYAKCRAAGMGCGSDKACDAVFLKYAKALSRGYKGSFEDFKKRSGNLAALGQLSMDLVGGLLSNIGGGKGEDGGGADFCSMYPSDPSCGGGTKKTGLYIVLGIAAVAAIGTAIYFARKD